MNRSLPLCRRAIAVALRARPVRACLPQIRFAGQFSGDTDRFRSDAAKHIANVEPIVVDGWEAMCDGGGGPLGHPLEFLQLNKVDPHEPETCKYCGLRYISKHAKEGHYHSS